MNTARDRIMKRSEDFIALYNAGDAAGLAALYTEDADFLAPGMPRFTGRDGIQKFWQRSIDSVVSNFQNLDFKVIRVYDDVCIQIFTFEMQIKDSAGELTTKTIKNVLTWEKHDDDWLINLDVWNSPA